MSADPTWEAFAALRKIPVGVWPDYLPPHDHNCEQFEPWQRELMVMNPTTMFVACENPERPHLSALNETGRPVPLGASPLCRRCRYALLAHAIDFPTDRMDFGASPVCDVLGIERRGHDAWDVLLALVAWMERNCDPDHPHFMRILENASTRASVHNSRHGRPLDGVS